MPYNFESSPNYTKGRRGNPDMVVIGSSEAFFVPRLNWLKDRRSQISVHYLIGRKGQVVQLVNEANVAWHSRKNNERAIAIELEDAHYGEPDAKTNKRRIEFSASGSSWWTPAQLGALEVLLRDILERYGISPDNVKLRSDPVFATCPPDNINIDINKVRRSLVTPVKAVS